MYNRTGLFAQCVEGAGQKAFKTTHGDYRIDLPFNSLSLEEAIQLYFKQGNLHVKLSGMSTVEEQKKYKQWQPVNGELVGIKVFSNWSQGTYIGLDADGINHLVRENEEGGSHIFRSTEIKQIESFIKPSEGSTKWLPVRFLLKEWLFGSDNQDEYPYLMGFVNALKSAMSYTGSKTLNEFKS